MKAPVKDEVLGTLMMKEALKILLLKKIWHSQIAALFFH